MPIDVLFSFLQPISRIEFLDLLNISVTSPLQLPTSCEAAFRTWQKNNDTDFFTEEKLRGNLTFDLDDFVSWVYKNRELLKERGQFIRFWNKIQQVVDRDRQAMAKAKTCQARQELS